jgi:hypothetical protein
MKKSAFFDTHHEGAWKIFFDPSYVPVRIFATVRGRAHEIEKFFMPVSHVLHQNDTTAGWQDPKKNFH